MISKQVLRNISFAVLLAGLIFFAAPASPGMPGLDLPHAEKQNLQNGIPVLYVYDDLPQTTIIASIGYGKLHEDRNTAGLSALLSEMIKLSGSRKYPGKTLHDAVESIGGRLSIETSWESTVISIKVLSRFSERAFDILSDLVANPNFNSSDLERARFIVIDEIRRKFDDPAAIAFEKAREIIFDGKGYGSAPSEKGVASYTIDNCVTAWKEYFTTGNMLLGINSSKSFKEMFDMAASVFSSVQQGPRKDYAVSPAEVAASLKKNRDMIFLYPKDIPQAAIVFGTEAPVIADSGTYALSLMNFILGGGSFNSRLMYEIRVKRGLAYAVQSVVRFRYGTGVFLAFAQTENSSVAEVFNLMYENIEAMSSSPVKDSELAWAKKSLRNSYVFNFDTSLNVLGNYLEREYNRLPDDYHERYIGNVMNVSAQDIESECLRMLKPGMVRVVVGDKGLAGSLSSAGRVVVLDREE